MGYILPIRSFSSEQYAMRLNLEPYNFAKINEVQRIKLKSDFLEGFEELLQSQEENKKDKDSAREEPSQVPSSHLLKMYSQPNPVNLSPAISQIVGKGLNVNEYI